MTDIAGFDLTPDSGSTLRKVLKLNLGTYMDQFESISAAATKVRSMVSFKKRFIYQYFQYESLNWYNTRDFQVCYYLRVTDGVTFGQ